MAADATDEAAMSALFDRFGDDLPPLQGIYLAAFAGQPVLLSEMTDEDVRAMFAPKLDAAALLHRLSMGTSATSVRHFVLFSSISGLTGSRWLAHYTATSGYLDAMAYARRVMGVPATTVNWGLWKSLADTERRSSQVSVGSGLLPMDDEIAIGALPYVMSPAAGVHSVVVEADWPLLADTYRTRGSLHIVDDLLPDSPAAASLVPARDWSHRPAQIRTELETGLRTIVARELRIPESGSGSRSAAGRTGPQLPDGHGDSTRSRGPGGYRVVGDHAVQPPHRRSPGGLPCESGSAAGGFRK